MNNLYKKIREQAAVRLPFLIVPICLWGLYLRFKWRWNHELWYDERYQLVLMFKPFWEFLSRLPTREFCPYLSGDYYLVYPFFRVFGLNKWGLAIPHIAVTVLGFVFLYLIGKQYFKTAWGFVIAFAVACCNATLINHSFEIRVYSVLPTLALGSFYVLKYLMDRQFQVSAVQKWGAGIFLAVVFLFHVYGVILIAFSALFLVLERRGQGAFKPPIGQTVGFLAAALLPGLPIWLVSVFGRHLPYPIEEVFQYTPSPFTNGMGFLKAVFGNLVGFKPFYFLLAGALFPVIFRTPDRYKQMAFVLLLVIAPLEIHFLISLATDYWFLQRQYVWVIPFFAIFLGWVWDSAIARVQKTRCPEIS